MKNNTSCAVLLAAFNGEDWIEEQIESILNQKNIDVHIYVSLDISSDSTIEILNKIIDKDKRVILLPYGEKFGNAAKNFYRLIKDVDFSNYDFISFSDQDDIWKENKLQNSCKAIREKNCDGFSSNVLAFWPNGKIKLIKKSQPQVKYDYFFESAGPGCSYVIKADLALNLIDEMLQIFPKNLILNITKSEILLSDQRIDAAHKNINKVLNISPKNYPASIIKSKILSAQKETIKAEEILRELLINKNNDPGLWLQLSEVQRAGKNIIGYHLSRGEYLMLLGDFESALNQFKFALALSNNSFQTSETIMTKIKLAQEKLGRRRGF